MRTNKLAIAILLGAAFLTSCEKEIEFNGKETDPRLVINSLVSAGEPVKANISKSYFFLDNHGNTQVPDDVTASLYVNGSLVGEMTPHFDTVWNDGIGYYDEDGNLNHPYHMAAIFTNDYRPQIGDVVKITASANGYDEVEGTTSPLPKTVDCTIDVEVTNWQGWYQHGYNFETYEYEEDSVWEVAGNMNLTFTITDPNPGQTDCFRLITIRDSNTTVGGNRRSISFDYDDPIFETGMTENDFFDASDLDTRPEGVFTDLLFDGGSYRIKVEANFYCDVDEDFDPDFFRVPFLVEHLSKEYYNYLNTSDQGDDFMQIWAEPIQTYSNVKNGFGLVGSRAVDTLWVPLPLEE